MPGQSVASLPPKVDVADHGHLFVRMSLRDALTLVVCLFSGVFLLLGGLFVALPAAAAAFYGLPTADPVAELYVRAIGFRDLALAAYLLGLALTGRRRALTIVLTATLIIPSGDLLLLALSGTTRPVSYLLHAASLLCFVLLALWSRRTARTPPG